MSLLISSIVISAFLHAFYNMLIRRAGGSLEFLIGLHAIAVGLAVGMVIATGEWIRTPWSKLPLVLGAALFYFAYQVLVAKCYEKGAVSSTYPLTVLSPIFIPLWARVFLGEHISTTAGAGIAVTIAGTLMLKLNALSWAEVCSMLRSSKDYRSARLALMASLLYSFGAVLDKSAVAQFPVGSYLLGITGFMLVFMIVLGRVAGHRLKLPSQRGSLVLGGIALFASFLFFRIPLQQVPVSIAVPTRQVSIVFAMLLGVLVLRESLRGSNMIGGLTVIAGVTLVSLGVQ